MVVLEDLTAAGEMEIWGRGFMVMKVMVVVTERRRLGWMRVNSGE